MNNTTKILFLSTMLTGTMMSISSNSWMNIWMGLEINLLSFIPMLTNNKYKSMNDTSIKYFIIQTLASTTMLFSVLMIKLKMPEWWEKENISSMLVSSSILLKMGAAPFHFWLPEVMNMSSWMNCLIIMTWQKIAPMMILSYCIMNNMFTSIMVTTSITIGAISGLNQSYTKQLMAYSSISHSGWMIASMIISETMWEMYFMIYSTLSTILILIFNKTKSFLLKQMFSYNHMNNSMKMLMMTTLLSIGGMPPFIGFLPKWMIIQSLIENNMTVLILIMVITTMINLIYYLRLSFSALIILYTENSWSMNIKQSKKMTVLSMMNLISTMGLIPISILALIY
uniref:NADH-ubiquinone oxidoreductase chain 2 n=1 Tax=Physemacris variolosa TaxID=62778 RepID=E0YCI7_9ORTH|nr:NADH dehydrogenase subunit 2 [Physemacris variolosa]ADD97022.1 NADH dehydrogenase subunit 2 [Physemacris variolosa]